MYISGADSLPPLESDPFNLHGCTLLACFRTIQADIQKAYNELSKQNTSGAPKTIRDNVILTLGNTLEQVEFFAELFDKARTILHHPQCIERYVREIKTETKNLSIELQHSNKLGTDLKENKATIKSANSWAEIAKVQTSPEQAHDVKHNMNTSKHREQEKLRQACATLAVILTTRGTSKEIRNQSASMHEKEITKRCQQAITESTLNTKPKLHGVSKLENGIHIHCNSEEEVKQLKNIDWNHAFEGVTVHKPKYSIVIHRVPMSDINLLTPRSEIIQQLETNNPDTNIIDVAPLLRKSNTGSTSHSVVTRRSHRQPRNSEPMDHSQILCQLPQIYSETIHTPATAHTVLQLLPIWTSCKRLQRQSKMQKMRQNGAHYQRMREHHP